MIAASILAGAILGAQGWPMQDLAEGGISLAAPGPFRLAATGADADVPQSVERFVWRAEDQSTEMTATYERWKTPQFDPDKSLEIYARRVLGMASGFTLVPIKMDGRTGSMLYTGSLESPGRVLFRAKSGSEAWQIDLRPKTGTLDPQAVEQVRASIRLAAAPEQVQTDAWGNLLSRLQPMPAPRPLPAQASVIKAARITVSLPVALKDVTSTRPAQVREGFESLSEWAGRSGDVEAAVTYLKLRPGQSIDLAGWVAAYGESLRDDGYGRFDPKIEDFSVPGATARLIKGEAAKGGRKASVQIILILRGREGWAVQTRIASPAAATIEKTAASSVKIEKE